MNLGEVRVEDYEETHAQWDHLGSVVIPGLKMFKEETKNRRDETHYYWETGSKEFFAAYEAADALLRIIEQQIIDKREEMWTLEYRETLMNKMAREYYMRQVAKDL